MDAILLQSHPPLRQRRQRTNFNDEALNSLEEAFAKNPYPDINERETIARELKTTEDRVQVWFQNKRARYRKRVQKIDDQSLSGHLTCKKSGPRPLNLTPVTTGQSPQVASFTANTTAYRFQDSCYLHSPHSDSGFASFQSPSSSQLWQSFINQHLQTRMQPCFNSSPITPEAGFSLHPREFVSSSPFVYNLANPSNQQANVSQTAAAKKPRVAKSMFKPYE